MYFVVVCLASEHIKPLYYMASSVSGQEESNPAL